MTTIESWYSSVPEFPPRDGRWGALLSWAYATWNPGALYKLPQVLMKYQGAEDELMSALADKYDPQLAERRKLIRAETIRANILKNLPPPPAPPGPGGGTVPAEPLLSPPREPSVAPTNPTVAAAGARPRSTSNASASTWPGSLEQAAPEPEEPAPTLRDMTDNTTQKRKRPRKATVRQWPDGRQSRGARI